MEEKICNVWDAMRGRTTGGVSSFSAISTGCRGLDSLLGRGVRTGVITELCGEASSGKSNLCLQVAVHSMLPVNRGGLGGHVCYISTEGPVPVTRMRQILLGYVERGMISLHDGDEEKRRTALAQVGSKAVLVARDLNQVLERVMTCSVHESADLMRMVAHTLPTLMQQRCKAWQRNKDLDERIRLVVVDSVAAPFRAGDLDRVRYQQIHSLGTALKRMAGVYDCAVLAVNQVSAWFKPNPRTHTSGGVGGSSLNPLDWRRLGVLGGAVWRDQQTERKEGHSSKYMDKEGARAVSWEARALRRAQCEQDVRMSSSNNPVKPTLGLLWSGCVNARLFVGRSARGRSVVERWVEVVRAPHLPAGSKCAFRVVDDGVADTDELGEGD